MSTSTAPLQSRPLAGDRGIERAGTCADGDNCPRWHCRACGHYWLGEASHACEAARDLERKICTWMDEALEEGDGDVATCARKVLEQVEAEGLGEPLLDTYGPRLIEELWRGRDDDDDAHHQDQGKANGVAKPSAAAAQTSSFAVTHGQHLTAQMVSRNARITATVGARQLPSQERQVAAPATNGHTAMSGTRRVDVEQLAAEGAPLECLVQVHAAWIRLGDLDKQQCGVLQREYATAAAHYAWKSAAFSQLVAGLAAGRRLDCHEFC